MGPKKKPKSSKQSKKSSGSSSQVIASGPAPVVEEPKLEEYKYASGVFRFPNGDTYEGDFCVHITGVAWREGRGIYTSNDGQVCDGTWKDDKLTETDPVKITYLDGTTYYGTIAKHKYHGAGIYELNTNMSVSGNFVDNRPSGEVIFIDVDGHMWYGVASDDYGVLLFKNNLYYLNMHENHGKGQSRIGDKEDKQQTSEGPRRSLLSEVSIDFEKLEQQFFGKSNKTELDLDYANSPWYKNYINFKQKLENILEKKLTREEFTEEEAAWYDNYLQFRVDFQLRRSKRKNRYEEVNLDLLKRYFSEEFQAGSIPIRVVYPSESDADFSDVSSSGSSKGDSTSLLSELEETVEDKQVTLECFDCKL